MLFEPVRDRYGWRLALVFGNHAAGGVCPYYRGELCHHCDIGAGEGAAFDMATNRRRLDWFREYYKARLDSISHVVLYNSGSVLNPREMPPELLDHILAAVRSFPSASVVSLDSREKFITPVTVRRIVSELGARFTVRPIMGIESADDRIRNELLEKAMPRDAILRVFRELGLIASELGPNRIGLDVNIVIGAPGTTVETAVQDAALTAEFALSAGARTGLSVDLNLHPYYIGPRGSARFPGHRRCSIETTARAATRIVELVRRANAQAGIFIGWQDEAHDLFQTERALDLKIAREAFDLFNQTNDPAIFMERIVI
jgi:hypothetical protein